MTTISTLPVMCATLAPTRAAGGVRVGLDGAFASVVDMIAHIAAEDEAVEGQAALLADAVDPDVDSDIEAEVATSFASWATLSPPAATPAQVGRLLIEDGEVRSGDRLALVDGPSAAPVLPKAPRMEGEPNRHIPEMQSFTAPAASIGPDWKIGAGLHQNLPNGSILSASDDLAENVHFAAVPLRATSHVAGQGAAIASTAPDRAATEPAGASSGQPALSPDAKAAAPARPADWEISSATAGRAEGAHQAVRVAAPAAAQISEGSLASDSRVPSSAIFIADPFDLPASKVSPVAGTVLAAEPLPHSGGGWQAQAYQSPVRQGGDPTALAANQFRRRGESQACEAEDTRIDSKADAPVPQGVYARAPSAQPLTPHGNDAVVSPPRRESDREALATHNAQLQHLTFTAPDEIAYRDPSHPDQRNRSDGAVSPASQMAAVEISASDIPAFDTPDSDIRAADGAAPDMPAGELRTDALHSSGLASDLRVSAPPMRAEAPHSTRSHQPAAVPDIEMRDGAAHLTLDGDELGRIEIRVERGEAGMAIVMRAERGESAELMRRNAEILHRELAERGIGDARLDFSQGGSAGHGPDGRSARHRMIGPPDASDAICAEAARQVRIATDRVDLRL